MIRGYYIHNQKKDGSGVSKKIDAQIKVFKEYFDLHEVILETKIEGKIEKKLRQKVFKRRPKTLYGKSLKELSNPDFVYIRKQILDADFFEFLHEIKTKYKKCQIIMEVPTYPYWSEFPKNKLGEKMIEEEKLIIPRLKGVVDLIVDVGNEKELFGIETININNGVDPDQVRVSSKNEKTDSINLLVVARLREANGYERIIESLAEYYRGEGDRKVSLHIVGDGSELSCYKNLAENEFCKDKVFFYGYKTGEELEKIYDIADLGLGFFGQYKTGGHYVSAIKCAEYLMRGIPLVSAVDEDYLKELEGRYYLSFPDDASPIDMNVIIAFYDKVYSNGFAQVHTNLRDEALKRVAISTVMRPVIDWIEKGKHEGL